MDPSLWERVEAICAAALSRAPEERDLFLDEACSGDRALRDEVEAQLGAFAVEPDFLETPIARVGLAPAGDGGESVSTKHVGSYRLIRPLARGGMGEVYLGVLDAEDLRQTVAIKLIRHGLESEEVVRRFRLERQILASLHHPNIAHLLDGGAAEDGRLYYVMEYVEGLPLDDYCDRNRLSIRRRLELFQVICGAVQHAHQNLVVHRDLKPGNILVMADGVPKLLDFGIGKVLASGGELGVGVDTRTEVRVLTPEYASPEQIRGGPVTTAGDVYALGVLLYELLTGHHPFATGDRTTDQVERAICEQDPARPSTAVGRVGTRRRRDGAVATLTPEEVSHRRRREPSRLRRRLSGDLDNIVLKAMRKDPARRYLSAAALAEDLQRHMDGLPVKARPDTVAYRAHKFLGRHALAVAAAGIVFLALAVTSVVTVVQSQRLAVQRDDALEVRSFLLEMFGATGADQATGDTVTARRLLDLQAVRLDELYADRPVLKAQMMEVLADGYDRLGLYAEAESLAGPALELRRGTLDATHPDVASSLNLLGWILHERGNSAEAVPLLREAVAIRRAAGRRHRLDLSRSLNDLGVVLERLGSYDEAEVLYREALDIRADLLGEEHRSVGITASNLAVVLYRKGAYDAAVGSGERALHALRVTVGADHQRSVIAQSNLAIFKLVAGQLASAEQEFRDLLERQRRLQGPRHPVTARVMRSLAGVLNREEEFAQAEPMAREALSILEAVLGPAHPDVAASLTALGSAVAGQQRYEDAAEAYRRALAIRREAQGSEHPEIGTLLTHLGDTYERMDQAERAERHFEQALTVLRSSLGESHPRTTAARIRLAEAHVAVGEYAAAESLLTVVRRLAGDGTDELRDRLARLEAALARRPSR